MPKSFTFGQSILFRLPFQIATTFILLGLLLHSRTNPKPLYIQTRTYAGIAPVTQDTLPLTPDDVARGLLAHPEIECDLTALLETYSLRQEFAEQFYTLQAKQADLRAHGRVLLHQLDTP